MIDHLLYNKAEWFNKDSDRLIPKQIKISPGAQLYFDDIDAFGNPLAMADNQLAGNYDCVGATKTHLLDNSPERWSWVYFFRDIKIGQGEGIRLVNCVAANDPNVTPIWGVEKAS